MRHRICVLSPNGDGEAVRSLASSRTGLIRLAVRLPLPQRFVDGHGDAFERLRLRTSAAVGMRSERVGVLGQERVGQAGRFAAEDQDVARLVSRRPNTSARPSW